MIKQKIKQDEDLTEKQLEDWISNKINVDLFYRVNFYPNISKLLLKVKNNDRKRT